VLRHQAIGSFWYSWRLDEGFVGRNGRGGDCDAAPGRQRCQPRMPARR
jgi:hypothetical protein